MYLLENTEMSIQPLTPDTSYYIFNHANGFEKVFRKEENFYFFLEKYWKYIDPIAETYEYNFSKVSNFKRSFNLSQSEFDKTKSVNFGKVITTAVFDKTKSVNFGKVITTAVFDKTKSVNFGKVVTIKNQFGQIVSLKLNKWNC